MNRRSTKPAAFFTAEEQAQIVRAIEGAERETSAELKLVVVRRCGRNIGRKAESVFRKYRLDETAEHNAVLILLAPASRQFLIYGDEGIHEKVGQSFWDDVRELMQAHFQKDAFGEGLEAGIGRIGEKLKTYFPCTKEDINEIDNGVAYDA